MIRQLDTLLQLFLLSTSNVSVLALSFPPLHSFSLISEVLYPLSFLKGTTFLCGWFPSLRLCLPISPLISVCHFTCIFTSSFLVGSPSSTFWAHHGIGVVFWIQVCPGYVRLDTEGQRFSIPHLNRKRWLQLCNSFIVQNNLTYGKPLTSELCLKVVASPFVTKRFSYCSYLGKGQILSLRVVCPPSFLPSWFKLQSSDHSWLFLPIQFGGTKLHDLVL